jgi:protein TonB
MKLNLHARITAPTLCLILISACSNAPPPSRPVAVAPPPVARAAPPSATLPPLSGQRAHFDNIEEYKADAADQIMRCNPGHTYTHALQPMLPAIVVMNIAIDKDGLLSKASVLRSRDSEASGVALAALKRCGRFPKPMNLMDHHRGSLEYVETFLFDDQYKFKLRTLAGPQ